MVFSRLLIGDSMGRAATPGLNAGGTKTVPK